MAALGIPTTRSLAAVVTGENVMRETPLPGAVLTRVASSHISRRQRSSISRRAAIPRACGGWRITSSAGIIRKRPMTERPYHALLEAVIARQADLVARWLLVGFIHGVMNTDNTSIIGRDHRLRSMRFHGPL